MLKWQKTQLPIEHIVHSFIYLSIYLSLPFINYYISNITILRQKFIRYSISEVNLSPDPDPELLHCHQTYHGPTMDFLNELLICLTSVVEVAPGHHANKMKWQNELFGTLYITRAQASLWSLVYKQAFAGVIPLYL